MQKALTTYAFIDAQNIHLCARQDGWTLDWKNFWILLREKFAVRKAYIFIGYLERNSDLYRFLKQLGYTLVFKETSQFEGKIKGNVDVELAVRSVLDLHYYSKAVIVSNDGDFSYLCKELSERKKLGGVVCTSPKAASGILKRTVRDQIFFLSTVKHFLDYKRPPGDGRPPRLRGF